MTARTYLRRTGEGRRLGAEEVMQNPEICRSQAMKCVLLAGEAKDFPYKLLLLSIAQLWRAIAETAEKVEAAQNREAAGGVAPAH
jgi:hypothetical protein